MTDGIQLNSGSGGVFVDTEAMASRGLRHVQRIKLVLGDMDQDGGDVSKANPMPLTSDAAATTTPLSGTVSDTAAHVFGPFSPQLGRPIWLTLNGTTAASGTAQILRSIDGGTTQLGITVGGIPWGTYTFYSASGAVVNEMVTEESSALATYYVSITLTAGSVAFNMHQ